MILCLRKLKYGGTQLIRIVLKNPDRDGGKLDYTITPYDTSLSCAWKFALKEILAHGLHLEKNFCFMGFPKQTRGLDAMINELNTHIKRINKSNLDYRIEEHFTPDSVWFDPEEYDFPTEISYTKHEILNRLHNHFEVLQGTVGSMSNYYNRADPRVKYSIRQLNNLCHEMETWILSQLKHKFNSYWTRPSQITTFLNAPRLHLEDEYREGFASNGYDRVFGGVYMHWCQIGKTYFEVFRDEGAPKLTDTVCEAITDLKYYSGEFDIEWGRDVVRGGDQPWHDNQMDEYYAWLTDNGKDITDPKLSLGYLPLGQVDVLSSFGTTDPDQIWDMMSPLLNIYIIEVDGVPYYFDYTVDDEDYENVQMQALGLL